MYLLHHELEVITKVVIVTSRCDWCMQAAGRRVAYHTFSHVLDLDVGFHLERRTGALSRILERGTATHCILL